jgi:hypothetical protein
MFTNFKLGIKIGNLGKNKPNPKERTDGDRLRNQNVNDDEGGCC